MSSVNMKILLTGKNGQVGFELQRSLAPLGEIVAVDHADCDLSNPEAIRRLVRQTRPEIIINPAAYTHTSVAILDALRLCSVPAVEVMLDAPDEREPFRKTDVVSFGCQGHFIGEGPQGYLHACIWLAQLLRTDGSTKAHIVM